MTKTRFAPWLVFACIGTLVGCTSGDQGGPAGNTELNVVIPSGSSDSGPGSPSAFDIQVVEYTVTCVDGIDFDPTSDPDVDSGPILDNDVQISGVAEVLDTPSGGVNTQDFGPDLAEVYVAQAFMDLPQTAGCVVELRARDADDEVICTAQETFDIVSDTTTVVNVLMFCGISYQAPVGMLDLNGDFSFNIANYCPDLFILNCIDTEIDVRTIPGIGETAATACQVRARDADSQCGDSCDPQSCVETPTGLNCTAAPGNRKCQNDLTVPCANTGDCTDAGLTGECIDAGVVTTVTCSNPGFFCAVPLPGVFGTVCDPTDSAACVNNPTACVPGAVQDCTGTNTPAANCTYRGDVLGSVGDPAPGPLAPGEGGFFVACVTADDDFDPTTPEVPVSPGATVTCTATTTDGDMDCNKTKTVEVICPGLSPCQAAGPGFCDDGNECTADSCDDSTGTAVCSNDPVPNGTACTSAPAPATCQAGVCVSQNCNAQADPDGSCDDGNECTVAGQIGSCLADGSCDDSPLTGNSCAGNTGVCQADGSCLDNCAGNPCDDGNQCTDDVCEPTGGANCTNTPDDTNSCDTCASGSCICEAGLCIDGLACPPAPVTVAGIRSACRNSFNQVTSTFPVDLTVALDDCAIAGQPFNAAVDPTLALDTAFLAAAADTLCSLGTLLTSADVSLAQVSIDALAGATCTETLSELDTSGGPVTVDVPVAASPAGCNCGSIPCDTVEVTGGISLVLPQVTVPCSSTDAAPGTVAICPTGTTPLGNELAQQTPPNITLSDPAVQTFVGVNVPAGVSPPPIQVVFQCGASSTTNPAPGEENEVPCAFDGNQFPSTPTGETCAAVVGAGDTGEQCTGQAGCTGYTDASGFPLSQCWTDPSAAPSDICIGGTNDGQPCEDLTDCPGGTSCERPTCLLFGTNAVPCSGTCTTVPVGLDPLTECVTFPIEQL